MLTHVVLCVNIEIEQRKNNKKQKNNHNKKYPFYRPPAQR